MIDLAPCYLFYRSYLRFFYPDCSPASPRASRCSLAVTKWREVGGKGVTFIRFRRVSVSCFRSSLANLLANLAESFARGARKFVEILFQINWPEATRVVKTIGSIDYRKSLAILSLFLFIIAPSSFLASLTTLLTLRCKLARRLNAIRILEEDARRVTCPLRIINRTGRPFQSHRERGQCCLWRSRGLSSSAQ